MGSSIAQFRLHGIVWQFGSGANRLSICTIRQQFLMFKAPSACEDAFAEIFGGHIMATRTRRIRVLSQSQSQGSSLVLLGGLGRFAP